jgi:hypothetical protein
MCDFAHNGAIQGKVEILAELVATKSESRATESLVDQTLRLLRRDVLVVTPTM